MLLAVIVIVKRQAKAEDKSDDSAAGDKNGTKEAEAREMEQMLMVGTTIL